MSFDAAVIGSGPNGLSAAIALARTGRSVVVYEARDTIGGSARTQELTAPGFHNDVCSGVHPMGAVSPFFNSLPLDEHGLEWVHPQAPLAHPFDTGPPAMLWKDLDRTAEELGAPKWATLARPLLERWDELVADAVGPPGVPSSPLLMARFGLLAVRPAYDFARGVFPDARGQGWFAGSAAHAVLPFDALASTAIGLMLSLAGHAVGWPFPRGGAASIPKALASYFASLGGTIRTGVTVTTLDEVETSGPVFFQTSPQALARIAGDALPQGYRRRLEAYRFGPGIFKVDWALKEPIPWRDPECALAATVHLGGTLEEIGEAEAAAFHGELHPRPYVLLTQPSLFDDGRAPEGGHTAWAYCHVPNGNTEDQTRVIEDQVERYAPGFRDVVLERHVRNTADVERYCPNFVGGDINVGQPTWDQLLTRPTARLNPYSTPNPRLFICSAASPPGGGVHGLGGWNAVRASGLV